MFTRRRLVIGGSITFLTRGVSKAQQTAAGPYSDLFVWARPISLPGIPWDHTWVTTYDNRNFAYPNIQAIVAAGESYWYAWGDFHAAGGTPENTSGFLGHQPGVLVAAKCISTPNVDCRSVPSARGCIFSFGIDGVCHQLSNQILYATRVPGRPIFTVSEARGYKESSFLYGTYGLQTTAWAKMSLRMWE